jgi:hypothetical protein
MNRRIAGLLAALALIAAAPGAQAAAGDRPTSVTAAKSCSSGYRHAVIGGKQKCLRAGQFCAHRYDSQYRRYGYRCTRYYSNVQRYRLTHA